MTELVARQFQEAGIDATGKRLQDQGTRSDLDRTGRGHPQGNCWDEPLMLARRLRVKIVVSRDRVQGVTLLASLGAGRGHR